MIRRLCRTEIPRSSPHTLTVTSPLDRGGGAAFLPVLVSLTSPLLSFLRSFQRGPGDQSWSSSQNGQEQGGGMYLVNHSFEKDTPPPLLRSSFFHPSSVLLHYNPPLHPCPPEALPATSQGIFLSFFLIICRENKLAVLLRR